ncbi:MAG: aspartate kinase [Acidimicrobiales bacterium]
MALVVQKFGGTSVADPDRIRAVADHVARTRRRGDSVVLVISAMGKETDELLRLADEVAGEKPGREMDMLITAGERKATALVSMALQAIGVPASSFTGSQAGFLTDTNHMNAKILDVRPERVRECLAAGAVPVVGGAQGVSSVTRDVTFLGRGGSDTTAVALAHVLGAASCELYTDVSGVFSADPRLVPVARRMSQISFDELLEMTATGCPKPAMRSVEFARTFRVPLHVRSAFTWERGTLVIEEETAVTSGTHSGAQSSMEASSVLAVTHDAGEAKVTVSGVIDKPGIAASLFRRLADQGVNVDMIVQNVASAGAGGATDISFTVPKEMLDLSLQVAREALGDIGARDVSGDRDIAKVSIIGAGMKSDPGVAARMFETLADCAINIEMISTSPIRTSCVIAEEHVERAVQALHTAFGLDAE